ncbi:cache domain-containing sensor histidine kinase [Paenibacillus sacheonensis]|uniref:histidine kinase n=1 Tax=Paenibacillus sacheonensis TaxID=742054 RepID=A0A7X5BZ06_9BACL|nr:histidine kinase [Paenibacillus sacheonensis]MBM7565248.1 two-component system sensor histidine kinase YesM [Paenibacillus sacheonensis]NBC69976.1 HAMP domain-containing protein [Paenibacillus sacheonensis]
MQKRLIIAYILILLLPSLLISFYIFNELNDNYMKDIVKKSENQLEIERINLNNNIETMERAAQLAQSDKEVLYYLERTSEPNASELIEFDTTAVTNILRLQFNNPNIEHIRLFSNNKRINEIWPVILLEKRIQSEPWYKKVNALDGGEWWYFDRKDREPIRPIVSDAKEDRPKLSLLREIEHPAGKHVGIMQVDMLLTNVFPNVFRGSSDEGQSQMFIFDSQGKMFNDPGITLMKDAGLTEADIRAELNSHLAGAQGHYLFTRNKTPFLSNYIYVEKIDAYVLNVVSLKHVFADIDRTRNKIIIAIVILLVILSISTYFLNALILKKLHMLAHFMKKVRQGDFNFDFTIRGGGEVGELAHHFRKMLKKINELIADAVTKQAASKETELRSLKNQIDSHFLYNTLENIKMLAEIENQPVISDALTSLGGMMRYNLRWMSEYVRLKDELGHITNYIAVMNLRFEHMVRLQIDVPPEYLNQELLKMSLQPIVENSVKHGMKMKPSEARSMVISISATLVDQAIVIVIADNGVGMSGGMTEELNRKIAGAESGISAVGEREAAPFEKQAEGSGIGLRNVHQRIQLFYGKEYGLFVESGEGEYTRVRMRIPYFIVSGGLV